MYIYDIATCGCQFVRFHCSCAGLRQVYIMSIDKQQSLGEAIRGYVAGLQVKEPHLPIEEIDHRHVIVDGPDRQPPGVAAAPLGGGEQVMDEAFQGLWLPGPEYLDTFSSESVEDDILTDDEGSELQEVVGPFGDVYSDL